LEFSNETSLSNEEVELVKLYIDSTKTHLKTKTEDGDLKYFLDFDLSILGSDEYLFDEYSKNVRKEYKKLNDEEWRIGFLFFNFV
jgi:predicted metal-dependent HD superfamily phosphohydrolase